MEQKTKTKLAAVVGLDWANAKHDIQLLPDGGEKAEHSVIEHSPEALANWTDKLKKRFGDRARIAVCVELAKGPVVYALQKHDIFVIIPINPASLAQYRKAWAPSGAKDDPTDAWLLLDMFLAHPDRLKPLKPQSSEMKAMSQLVEIRRTLVEDRVRITNRMTAALKNYFPRVLG